MKKPLLFCALITLCLGQSHIMAEIEFIYAIKERSYKQTGNQQATTAENWNFGMGVSGDDQVTAASVTYPGSGGPVALSGEPGDYELGDQDFQSKAALDAAYPNGDVSITVTDNGSTIDLGPFPVTGDNYPPVPHILNATGMQDFDFSQPYTVQWAPFAGADASSRILFQVFDDNNGQDLLFEFLDSSATSYEIPGGTFSANRNYEVDVVFAEEVDDLESPDTIAGYLTTTVFLFSTFQQTTDDQEVLVSRGIVANQTSGSLPTSGQYSFLAEAEGASFSSVTLIKPDSSEVNVPSDGSGEFFIEETFGTEGERDAAYPEGNYTVKVVSNAQETELGPLAQSGAATPVIPGITNWDAAQSIDPNQDFTLSWNDFSNAGDEAFIEIEIWNTSDQSNEVDFNLPSDSQGILLSSAFLQPNSTYQGEIIFINPAIFPQTINGIQADSFYEAFTSFTLQTDDGQGGGNGGGDPTGINFIYVIKEQAFDQIGNFVDQDPAEWNFGAGVDGGDLITAASITYPGSGGPVNLDSGDGDFELGDQDFLSKEALDASFPNGQVSLNVTVDGNNLNLGPFDITGDDYPETPNITNAAALLLADYSQDFTLMWNPFVTSDLNDRIRIQLERTDDGETLFEEFIEAGDTSYIIPANTLEMNREYELVLLFINETDGLETPETIIGYLSTTRFNFSTYPDFNASPDLDIFLSKGTFGVQNSEQDPGVQQWFFFAEAEVNGITEMTVNLPNGNNVSIPPSIDYPNLFEYEERFETQEALNEAFPDGTYNVTVTVNGIETINGPYDLTSGGTLPNQPYFTNWADFQQADPSSPFTVEWSPFSNPPQDAFLELEIQSAPGYGDLDIDFDFADPSSTSTEIPANTLEPDSKYIMTGFFLSPSTTGSDPEVFLGYETFVQTTFWTGDPTVGPSPATNLVAQILNGTTVQLDWTDNSNSETGFRVERKAIWEEDWSALANTAENISTFQDTTVAIGEAYAYRIVAFDASADGARSNEADVQMQPPNDPTGLEVDPYNSTTLTLSWDDNSEGEAGFDVDRSSDGTNWSTVGTTGPDENIFIDSGLDAGSTFTYRVRAINGLGSSDNSDPDSDTTYIPSDSKATNISTRGTIGAGEDFIMIAGFIIKGDEPKDIYIRGIAPSLPITGETQLLQDPELVLFDVSKVQIDFNDDWQDHARVADINATFIPPPNEKEAAIFATLPATPSGTAYTVWMRGADGGVGAGLIEVYEANPGNNAKLTNISTRGIVGSGDGLMIAGVIVKGTGSRTLYIRGNGPSLPSNLQGRLTDTSLVMRDGEKNLIASSDNWQENDNFASIAATTIPPGFPEEAALLVNVPASPSGERYTIELRGAPGEEGLAIIEIFEVPD